MTNYRNEKGYLTKGHPGLPGAGRPPVDAAIRAEMIRILQEATPHAARQIVAMMDDPDPKVRLQAIDVAWNRIYGKPVAQIEAKVETTNVQQAHLAILMELQAKREQPSRDAETVEATAIDVTPSPPPVPAQAAAVAPEPSAQVTEPPAEGSAALRAWRRRHGKAAE